MLRSALMPHCLLVIAFAGGWQGGLRGSNISEPSREPLAYLQRAATRVGSAEAFHSAPCADMEVPTTKPYRCRRGGASISEAGTIAKENCIGTAWNKRNCKCAVSTLRRLAWPHIQELARETKWVPMNSTLSLEHEPHVKVFRGGGGYGAAVPCGRDGQARNIFYRHIWKDAGEVILHNMRQLSDGPWIEASPDRDWDKNRRCPQLMAGRRGASSDERPLLFTFVRNPIDKFVAGYKELAQRGRIDNLRGYPVGTTRHALAFIDIAFKGACDNGHVLMQAANLMSIECESRFDFIGKLETFERDWQNMSMKAGCATPMAFNRDLFHHESESDSLGAGKTMTQLLNRRHHRHMKMLCWWLLPDFVLFDYELPDACARDPEISRALPARGEVP